MTADSVAALLDGEEPAHDLGPFSPLRFISKPAVAEAGPMTVELNGRPVELPDGATVAAMVELSGAAPEGRGVAVAVDGDVVPRSEWDATASPRARASRCWRRSRVARRMDSSWAGGAGALA